MVDAKRLRSGCIAVIVSLIFLFSVPCYAVDTGYLTGDSVEEMYWSDCENIVNINEPDFVGNVKYIPDEDNGCMYIRVSFYSTAENFNGDSITVGINVSNSVNSYSFGVQKMKDNGEVAVESYDDFKVYSAFDLKPGRQNVGNIYIGFDMKNKTDKSLDNVIGCEFFCGNNCVYNLFDNAHLNMEKPEKEAKKITNKTTKSKKTTSKAKTTKSSKSTTKKTTTKKTSQTKYIGSRLYKAGQNTKIEADEENNETESNTATEEVNDNTTQQNEQHKLSQTAKATLISAGVIFAAALIVIFIALASNSLEKTTPPPKTEKDDD